MLAYVFERRKDTLFLQLKASLEPFGLTRFYTDDWGAYERHLDAEKHKVGKAHTQRIESKHINLRTRIKRLVRRTICFSKTERMHDLIIGLLINRYEFGIVISGDVHSSTTPSTSSKVTGSCMALGGFSQLKPRPGPLASRTLTQCLHHFPGKRALQVKRPPRAARRDGFGAQLQQEQIRHDRHSHGTFHPAKLYGDLMLAQAHHPFHWGQTGQRPSPGLLGETRSDRHSRSSIAGSAWAVKGVSRSLGAHMSSVRT